MFNKEKPVEVKVDKEKCTKCGACLEICPIFLKKDENGFPIGRENNEKENIFGCIQCGNCMMICQNDAIEIKGDDINNEHLRELNPNIPDYEAINSLFLKRRSCRAFKDKEVERDDIDKIINSAATAAVSLPPSEVKVLVINGKDKVQALADDLFIYIKKFVKMAPLFLLLIRLMAGKTQYKMFKEFILPLSKELVEKKEKGIDHLFYNAPAVMLFYGSEHTDKEDYIIAATQATIAAESLGLGTCFIGMASAMFQKNPKIRKKYGILKGDKVGAEFVLGHPDIKFRKAFQRNFKEVRFI